MAPVGQGLVWGLRTACRTHWATLRPSARLSPTACLLSGAQGGSGARAWLFTSVHPRASEQPDAVEKEQDVGQEEKGGVAQNLPGVLQAATSTNSLSSAYKGLQQLSDWVSNKKVDFKKDLEGDEKFEKLITVIDRGVMRSSPASLLAALKSLMILGVDSHSHVVQSIEMQIQWNLRKLSFPVLLSTMALQVNYQHTDLQKTVFRRCIESIQRRWVEVRTAGELEVLYSHHAQFTSEFLGQLDDRATELAASMTYSELAKVLCVLGSIRRRATPVIRALAFHMAKQADQLTTKQLGNVLFAMNSLSFPDPVLLEKIAADLIPQVEKIDKPKLVGTILFCIGQMRWRHERLLEALCEWTERNMAGCPLENLSALTLTLAVVGYEPSNADVLFDAINSRLTPSSLSKKITWLEVVWALTVLRRVNSNQVASVLEQSFVTAVPPVEQHLKLGVRLKLLNIDAASSLLPSYNGPRLNLADFRDAIITSGRDELKVSQHVLTMLHNLLPPPRYIHQGIQTSMGIFVDAEFATDRSGKPLPIHDFRSSFSQKLSEGTESRNQEDKKLPEGATKLALLVWNYKDYTIGSQELTGVNKLALEMLRKEGYRVVQVPFFEYNIKGKTLKNVQYLEAKIKEALAEG